MKLCAAQSHLGYALPCGSSSHTYKQTYQKKNGCSDENGVHVSIQVNSYSHWSGNQRKHRTADLTLKQMPIGYAAE